MSNRVLKRPMFRRGGMANQGIMTGLEDRSGYQEGGDVNRMDNQTFFEDILDIPPAPIGEMTREEAKDYLYDYSSLGDAVDSVGRNIMGYSADAAGNFVANPLISTFNFLTGADIPTSNYNYKGKLIDRYSGTVRDDEGNIISSYTPPEDAVPEEGPPGGGDPKMKGKGAGGDGGDGSGGDLSESDLKTVYADLLPMFKETLGVDDEDFKKDAYLQLARFGTNLMAQPGGSLTAAIGRAAEKPLEGVGEIIGAKRAAERRPKELALQAALRETDPGTIGKSVRDLMKLGYTKDQAIKAVVERGGGEATLAAVKARVIDGDAEALIDITNNKSDARKIAKQMYKYGVNYADIEGKLPDDMKNLVEGGYYIDKIKGGGFILKRHSKGKLYSVGEKGFIAEETE
tara:strand:- start:3117 stop:4319 length:1203 start_codon:yes stop_codon:yes gene_type:complete